MSPDTMPVAQRLADALRHQRAYSTIYEQYLRTQPRADFRVLLDALQREALESAEALASTLRRMGERPTQAAPPERLLQQGLSRRGTIAQLEFIVQGVQHTADYCRAQLARDEDELAHAAWARLLDAQERHLLPLRELLDKVQHPERE